MRSFILTAALLVCAELTCVSAAFAASHTVIQTGRRFRPGEITIAKGDTVTFTNNDEFIHQIYVAGPNFSFDTTEKSPGENDTETFTTAGTFAVQCHIHPKMKLVVHVN
jgi:plastocyanin